MNKDIENALLGKTLNILLDGMSKNGGILDLNGLIKQNMDEILELKLENQQLSSHLSEL